MFKSASSAFKGAAQIGGFNHNHASQMATIAMTLPWPTAMKPEQRAQRPMATRLPSLP